MGMTVSEANKAIGSKVRGLRAEKNWNREELAERSGVPVMTIRRIEDGVAAAKTPTLIALLRALGAPVGEFLDTITEKIDQAGGLDPE